MGPTTGPGGEATVAWLAEELGELAKAARKGTPDEQLHELGDVLAWLASLADSARPVARRGRSPLRAGVPPMREHPCRVLNNCV